MRRPVSLARSQAQEKRAARTVGARQHSGSGNQAYDKNDASSDRLHVECKGRATDTAKQITVKVADLRDVERNAALNGKIPVLHLEVGGKDYWMLPQWGFEELFGEA
jgi:hypothetical protein